MYAASVRQYIFRYMYLKVAGRLMREKKMLVLCGSDGSSDDRTSKKKLKEKAKEKKSEINQKCCFCAPVMTVATTEQVVKRKKKKKLRARSKDFPPRRAKTGVFSFLFFPFCYKKKYTYTFFLYRRARTVGRTPTYVSA